VGRTKASGGKVHQRMKGEEKSEVVETVSVIVDAGAVSAIDQIQRYKV